MEQYFQTRTEYIPVASQKFTEVTEYIQVNENSRGHIGIVEKAQKTSWDTDMHSTVYMCHPQTVDVSWNAETLPHHR